MSVEIPERVARTIMLSLGMDPGLEPSGAATDDARLWMARHFMPDGNPRAKPASEWLASEMVAGVKARGDGGQQRAYEVGAEILGGPGGIPGIVVAHAFDGLPGCGPWYWVVASVLDPDPRLCREQLMRPRPR